MGYYEAKLARDRALLRALGCIEEEAAPTEPQGPPNFDGGAREPVLESDPVKDHNALLVKLFEGVPRGTGGADEW